MQELSKFKVFTVAFICLFVFVVAVIYTNTKEMAETKTGSIQKERNIQHNREIRYDRREVKNNALNIQELNQRLNDLTRKVNNLEDSGSKMNCKIQGVMTENGLEAISSDFSLSEASNSRREIVMTCSF